MESDDLPCSRNARSRTPLVGRAQWEINQAPSQMIGKIGGTIRWRYSFDVRGEGQLIEPSLTPLLRFEI